MHADPNKEASEHFLSNWIDQDCIFSEEKNYAGQIYEDIIIKKDRDRKRDRDRERLSHCLVIIASYKL